MAPQPVVGGSLFGTLRRGPSGLGFRLHAGYRFNDSATSAQREFGVSWLGGGVEVCPHSFRSEVFSLEPCAGFELGRYSALPGLDPGLLPNLVERAHAAGLRTSVHVETAADYDALSDLGRRQAAASANMRSASLAHRGNARNSGANGMRGRSRFRLAA